MSTEKKEQEGGHREGSGEAQFVRVLGRYVMTRTVIGKGRFGRVFKGYDAETHESVAFKVLNVNAVSMGEVVEMKRVKGHPNFVKLLDSQINPHYLVLVLEYCAGGDLEKLLRRTKLSERTAQRLCQQIVAAMAALHAKKTMHRDFKPANILLTSKNPDEAVIKVGDMGFARNQQSENFFESSLGTGAYMSPERLRNEHYGFESEMWAVGIIAYEMVFGFHPFQEAKSGWDLLQAASKELQIPVEPTVSAECIDFIKNLIVFDPKKRLTAQQAASHTWIAQQLQPQQTNEATPEIASEPSGQLEAQPSASSLHTSSLDRFMSPKYTASPAAAAVSPVQQLQHPAHAATRSPRPESPQPPSSRPGSAVLRSVDDAKLIASLSRSSPPDRAAVLCGCAKRLLGGLVTDDAIRLRHWCDSEVRRLLYEVPLGAICPSPTQLIVDHALRLGRMAAEGELFGNYTCGSTNEKISDVYAFGKRLLMLAEKTMNPCNSREADAVRRAIGRFQKRVEVAAEIESTV